ncbi:hypothetical protein E2542_SST28810 [Spatholobus suberectus]|nr:hypothetical protein E2542_SST28810 [Spatholobus suberectus]
MGKEYLIKERKSGNTWWDDRSSRPPCKRKNWSYRATAISIIYEHISKETTYCQILREVRETEK